MTRTTEEIAADLTAEVGRVGAELVSERLLRQQAEARAEEMRKALEQARVIHAQEVVDAHPEVVASGLRFLLKQAQVRLALARQSAIEEAALVAETAFADKSKPGRLRNHDRGCWMGVQYASRTIAAAIRAALNPQTVSEPAASGLITDHEYLDKDPTGPPDNPLWCHTPGCGQPRAAHALPSQPPTQEPSKPSPDTTPREELLLHGMTAVMQQLYNPGSPAGGACLTCGASLAPRATYLRVTAAGYCSVDCMERKSE